MIFLNIFLFLSCNDSKKKDNTSYEKKDSIFTYEKGNSKIKDQSENNYIKRDSIITETSTKYPNWLRVENQKITSNFGGSGESKINSYVELNDSISYAVFEFNDGVCSINYLKTFLNQKEKENIEIGLNCDHEISIPEYKWKTYEFITSERINLVEYREYVHDSMIDSNGRIKEGFDFLELETKIDSVFKLITIENNGKILKQ